MISRTIHYTYIVALLLLIGAAIPLCAQTINGNVYGGGEMAKVDGSTTVTINAGSFGADIFGGGEGKLYTVAGGGHSVGDVSMSADVSGTTHVTINGGEFAVAYDGLNFKEHYNIYGGGNIASQVGESHVYVTKGMVSNTSDGSTAFLDNDRFASGEAGMAQAYYHEGQMYFCIFGGGFGKNTSVEGNTWVDFHINGMTDINLTVIEDDLLEYQSYLDIVGGGFNGTVQGNTNVHVGGNAMCRNVYGGGLYATIGRQDDAEKGKTNVHITGGNIDNVYGGGVMGDIMTSTNVNIGLKSALDFDGHNHAKANDKITILMSVYGGNDVSGHVPTANITHNGGTVDQNIYGAGNGDYTGYYTPNLCAYADGENDNYFNVTHAGDDANSGPTYKGRPQTDNVSITMGGNSAEDKAVVLGQVFGGGNSCTVGHWKTDLSSKYDGDPHAWRNDPDFFEGGGQLHITLGSHVKIGYDNTTLAAASDDIKAMYVRDEENVSGLYMGASGSVLATQSDAANYHHYYDATARQYKPGFASTDGTDAFKAYLNNILVWTDDVQLIIANEAEDIWLANFVGGGFRGSMKRKTATNYAWTLPTGVTIGNCILGGAYNADVKYVDSNLDLRYAGGLLASDGTNHADVVLTLNNRMDGGEDARVFGGCFSSGTVNNTQIDYHATGAYDVYGGGALANLTGNSVVNLLGGSLTNAYGGGLGSDEVAAYVNGDATVTLNGSVVNGSIFGANNVNGTPKGHVKVHVLRTTPRDGQSSPKNTPDNEDSYDVLAVYGGGNQAAYNPTSDTDFAEVLIENCDNSIAYVYGGGNAAPVPATDVKIYGANAIDNAFAGGNGAGDGNPGADIGYLDYTRNDSEKEYGSGTASIAVYGGTVHNVYGGSNTLGYIRTGATVTAEADADYTGTHCDLNVNNVFGGGNEADMNCDITMTINCSEGGKILYAGANNADVNGSITLNIHSGTYEQVFCGNNQGGAVRGKLEINVEETGCTPIIIKELFGGGNLAPYSVYGYNNDGTCKTSGEQLYTDPTINVISCTAIGTIYGGGYGSTALMYGNPIVNVDMVKGKWATESITRAFHVIKEGNFFSPSTSPSIPNEIGAIGNIFGGGKEAAVYGNTTVNVCVQDANKDANIAPLPEEFITFGLEETNVIDYNTANSLPSTMTWEGTTGGLTSANIHMDNDAVDCINFNDSYNNEKTKNQLILAPVGGFKAGDKVTIAGFYNHDSEQTSRISLFNGSQNLLYTTGNFINGQLSNDEPNIFEYTLTADTDRLFVRRGQGSGTKTYVTKLVITGMRQRIADLPTGSIYGGGKLANVYGNTKVHIRNGNVEGNVFGAGQGDANLPDAAQVKGKTEVIIGEQE